MSNATCDAVPNLSVPQPVATTHGGIYLERRGNGPPLVLLHGWGLNLRVFDGLAATLAPHHTLLAVDLPGHGRSTASDLNNYPQLLACLPEKFALLGWSLGGQIALQLAAFAPTRITALVLVSTTPRFEATTDWQAGLAPAVLAQFARQLQRDYPRTVSEFLELQVRGSVQADATLAQLRAALLSHGEASPAALTTGLELLRDNDLRLILATITAPTLLIAGQYDRVTPTSAARSMAARLPSCELLEIRRAGHAPFLSHLAECCAAIEALLGTADSGSTVAATP